MDTTEQDVRFQQAKKRVEEIKGFYTHLAIYAIVSIGLLLIDLVAGKSSWWFYWPLLGWGIAVAIHAVVVFVVEGTRGQAWEERKIHELMERDQSAGQA
jgi:hypothetical protein